ncbi:hypothetical protein ZONE111905_01165 [Zobellia nedashkovskayae]
MYDSYSKGVTLENHLNNNLSKMNKIILDMNFQADFSHKLPSPKEAKY